MTITKIFLFITTNFFINFTVPNLLSTNFIENIIFPEQSNYHSYSSAIYDSVNNSLYEITELDHTKKIILVDYKLSKLVSGKFLKENKKINICGVGGSSIFTDLVNMFARLLIIGGVGSLGIGSHSSSIERHLEFWFKDYLFFISVCFLLLFLAISSIFAITLTSAHSLPSSSTLARSCL